MTARELEDVALAVADGDAVDWSRELDSGGSPAAIGALRLIAAIAAGYRKDLEPADTGSPAGDGSRGRSSA